MEGQVRLIHDQGRKTEYRPPRPRIHVSPCLTINSFQYNLADRIRYEKFGYILFDISDIGKYLIFTSFLSKSSFAQELCIQKK